MIDPRTLPGARGRESCGGRSPIAGIRGRFHSAGNL